MFVLDKTSKINLSKYKSFFYNCAIRIQGLSHLPFIDNKKIVLCTFAIFSSLRDFSLNESQKILFDMSTVC